MMDAQTPLAERLRLLRAHDGLTLVEAAEKIGIGRDTLSDLERGRRHPVMPTLAKIARGYDVPVEEFVGDSAAPKGKVPKTSDREKRPAAQLSLVLSSAAAEHFVAHEEGDVAKAIAAAIKAKVATEHLLALHAGGGTQ